jgi:hypothetical protein
MIDFKPEEKAEIIIWDWLKTKGISVVEVYFNRQNKLGWKTFSVKGIQKKPDFLIEIDNGYGREYLATEVKPSDNSKDILDAHKIIAYWERYVTKKTKYFINDKEIKIKHFLIATDNSPKGYLFAKEDLVDNLADTSSKSKHYVASIGLIPRYEGNRTFEFVRMLWNLYGKVRINFEEKCGLGILIADVENSFAPKIMITTYYPIKKRWCQRWWNL